MSEDEWEDTADEHAWNSLGDPRRALNQMTGATRALTPQRNHPHDSQHSVPVQQEVLRTDFKLRGVADGAHHRIAPSSFSSSSSAVRHDVSRVAVEVRGASENDDSASNHETLSLSERQGSRVGADATNVYTDIICTADVLFSTTFQQDPYGGHGRQVGADNNLSDDVDIMCIADLLSAPPAALPRSLTF